MEFVMEVVEALEGCLEYPVANVTIIVEEIVFDFGVFHRGGVLFCVKDCNIRSIAKSQI